MRLKNHLAIIAAMILLSSVSYSENSQQHRVKTNRYTDESTKLDSYQTDLLSVIITIQFPQAIRTVGEAIQFLLSQSGYQLDENDAVDDSQYYLYQLPLPETHRYFDHVSLKSVLEVMSNKSYSLVVNPVKRTISYQLLDQYKKYINDQNIALAKSTWFATNKSSKKRVDKRFFYQGDEGHKENHRYYGPIRHGESLSKIVYANNHYGVKDDIVMAAIYLKNSHAFINEDINLLIEGEQLMLPDKEFVHSISSDEAENIINSLNKR